MKLGDDLDLMVGRALDAEGAAISPAPDAWERFRQRRDDTAPAGSSPAGRGWWLAAAAVVAGFGGLATALALLTGGDGEVRTASPSAGAADEASSGTTLDVDPEGATRPPTALAVTDGGALLRIDVATGAVEPVAGHDEGGAPGPDDGGLAYDGVAAGLDGTVLASTCCEPASGETFLLEPSGDRTLLSHGYGPALAPDGARFALVDPGAVTIHHLDGQETHRIDAGAHAGNVMSVAWSPPQGDRLAVEVATGATERRVLLVDADATTLDGATELVAPAGTWWSQPVFRADGSLLVAEHPIGLLDQDAGEGSAVRVVSPDGRSGETIDLGGLAPWRLAADRSGRWVLVAAPSGRLAAVGPDGAVTEVPVDGSPVLADLAW